MSRPRQYDDRVSSYVRLPRVLHEQLRATAAERDVSVNLLIERAVRKYLAGLVPIDEVFPQR